MPGGGRIRIELARRTLKEGEPPPIASMTPGAWAALTVADSGCGMSPAVQRRLFEPFFSTKDGNGTGLGLAQVYGIVKQHGGHIDVASEVGRGTTVTVYLPLAGVPGEPRARMRRARKVTDLDDGAGRALPTGSGEVILLVEDDAAARLASTEALQSLGYRVLAAESAEQAWELWERHRDEVALVLTDLMLPGVGGAHLCSALARQGRAPVIVHSGYAIDPEDSRLAGVAHLLQKPLAIERLARVIHDTLAAARH
jgi:two-component system, cell cycle sensor histidine kinase and response regulator CckA